MQAKLTARAFAAAKPGRHGDGGGLWLEVSPAGNRRWVYRFSYNKRVTESLGSAATMTVAEARIAANDARKLIASGINPIEERISRPPASFAVEIAAAGR